MIKDTDFVNLNCEYDRHKKIIQMTCTAMAHLKDHDPIAYRLGEAASQQITELGKDAAVWSCPDYYSDTRANMRLAVMHFINSFGTVENPAELQSCHAEAHSDRDMFIMSPTAIKRNPIVLNGGNPHMTHIHISSYYDKLTCMVTVTCQAADAVQKINADVKELLRVIARLSCKSNSFFRDDYLSDPYAVVCECFGEFLKTIAHLLPSDIGTIVCVSSVRYIMRVGSHNININNLIDNY
jgi:hypothetical protein